MQKTTRDFLREAARAQVAVVYYAGHGVQIDGRNYLVPVDVQLQAGASPTDAMIDMDTILAGLDDQVRTNILILDACRNNPLEPQVASAGAEPRHRGRIGTGGAGDARCRRDARRGHADRLRHRPRPGRARRRRRRRNSPFAAALSRHIGTPGLEVQQMLTRVRAEVVAATRSRAGAVVEFVAARRGLSQREVNSAASEPKAIGSNRIPRVMAGLVPAIHVFERARLLRRGCPRRARA